MSIYDIDSRNLSYYNDILDETSVHWIQKMEASYDGRKTGAGNYCGRYISIDFL